MAGKRGRPGKGDEALRSVISVRATQGTKDRLVRAAEAADRSLTQEIEQRLEWSIDFEDELGGPDGVRLFKAMAQAMSLVTTKAGHWRSDYAAFACARDAVLQVLNAYAPPYPIELVQQFSDAEDFRKAAEAEKQSLRRELEMRLDEYVDAGCPSDEPIAMGLMAHIQYIPVLDDDLSDAQLKNEVSQKGLSAVDADLLHKYHQAKRRERVAIAVIDDALAKISELEEAARQRTSGLIRASIERGKR